MRWSGSLGKARAHEDLLCAGSAAIGELAECVAINPEQLDRLADFAEKEKIDLTVVGPELPLTLGIVDLFESRGLEDFRAEQSCRPTRRQQSFHQGNPSRQRYPNRGLRHIH
jgi:phosphoribosylamine--glycine ligase